MRASFVTGASEKFPFKLNNDFFYWLLTVFTCKYMYTTLPLVGSAHNIVATLEVLFPVRPMFLCLFLLHVTFSVEN